ncbi:hypothetical protein Hanom_Chr07g00679761 [Helianthus anomalus]
MLTEFLSCFTQPCISEKTEHNWYLYSLHSSYYCTLHMSFIQAIYFFIKLNNLKF